MPQKTMASAGQRKGILTRIIRNKKPPSGTTANNGLPLPMMIRATVESASNATTTTSGREDTCAGALRD